MGNCSAPATEPLHEEYHAFRTMCCEESCEVYTTYTEYVHLFSLYLQRQSATRRSEPDDIAESYIYGLCKVGALVRYGPLLLGVRVLRVPPTRNWIEV